MDSCNTEKKRSVCVCMHNLGKVRLFSTRRCVLCSQRKGQNTAVAVLFSQLSLFSLRLRLFRGRIPTSNCCANRHAQTQFRRRGDQQRARKRPITCCFPFSLPFPLQFTILSLLPGSSSESRQVDCITTKSSRRNGVKRRFPK